MIKHCVSDKCCVIRKPRRTVFKNKVDKDVEENVSQCPDCGDTLILLKQHRKAGNGGPKRSSTNDFSN